MGILHVFDSEPDFINDEGVKWWKDEHSTRYATKPDMHETSLDMSVWLVENADGKRNRVIVDNQLKTVIHEDSTLEGIGVKIDMLKLIERSS